LGFAVDGAAGGGEAVRLGPEVSKADLVSVDARAAAGTTSRDGSGLVGHGVALHAGDEVVAAVEQGPDDLARAVEGVGDQDDVSLQERCDGEDEADEPVEQGAPVAVGEDEAFVDPADRAQKIWPRGPCTSRPMASNECPKMKVGLELFSDCWNSFLTAGI
jgi:hypothetical protein